MALLLLLGAPTLALVLHGVAAPILFGAVAWHYFRARGAREPLSTAIAWTAIAAALDLAVLPGAWISLPLVFLATWTTGSLVATLPWSESPEKHEEGEPELHPR
jgi:hypothetical protein